MSQTYKTLEYDVSDFIPTVTLSRPEQLNSFAIKMRQPNNFSEVLRTSP